MSFSFRDRPSLSERLRGRTGDQLLQDLEKELEEEKKMFFDRGPVWNTTPRSGSFSRAFPFDDSPRRQDVRSHLEDLAQRHPEFADHLRCPPWGGEVGSHGSRWDRKQPSTESHKEEDSQSQASNSSSASSDVPSSAERQGGLSHHGLRNTVDIGQQQHSSEQQPKESRGQRSMSAPPSENRSQSSEQAPPRYVTRLNITPSSNVDNAQTDQGKPPVAPKQPQSPQQQPQATSPPKQQSTGNVRHIPIFVEGRDEPVLPKNIDPNCMSKSPRFQHSPPPPPPPHSFGRPVYNTHHQFEPQPAPRTPPQTRKFQQQARPQHSPSQPAPPPPPQQQHAPPPPQQQHAPSPPKPQPPPANDPISRVMAIQKDVDELAKQVDEYSGTSRKDKEYIYLDEMLTRHLLKLDDIETEGKENVRLARKEAIRSIQKCIGNLEGKVPLLEAENTEPMESTEDLEEAGDHSEVAPVDQPEQGNVSQQTMEVESEAEVDQSSKDSVEKSEKMEVEPASVSGELQEPGVVEKQEDVSGESEESKVESAEPVKIVETPEEKTMEVEDTQQSETASAKKMSGSETSDKMLVDNAEAVVDKTEADVPKEQSEAGAPIKPEESMVVGASKEISAEEQKMAAVTEKETVCATVTKPVQDGVTNVDEVKSEDVGNKGSESPRLKGKGTKAKKEGAKTRKGKAGKSAERKSSTADGKAEAASKTARPESVEDKVGDSGACGDEPRDVDKAVSQVVDAVSTA